MLPVALGGPDHGGRTHRSVVGHHLAGLDALHRGLLADRHAKAFHHFGESPGQPGRIDRRAVRSEGATEHVGGPDHAAGFVGPQQTQVGVGGFVSGRRGEPGLHPLPLGRGPGQHDGATGGEAAVDAFGLRHPTDFPDGLVHGQLDSPTGTGSSHLVKT